MRSLKKVLALLTVIAMIFSTTAAFGATFKDVDGTDYEAAVVTLSSLDVLNGYEDGTFKPEGDITRAEFAKVVIAVMNMTASAGKTATSFTDVDSDNWASGYVKLAEQMGIIKGYGNGKFGPQDNVTYEQAVKMIVAALGFTPKAEALGGYPTGYMVVAAQEEITKGIKADASKAASRGVVAQLVYNALEVEMMEQTGYGTDVTYAVPENAKTLLADYLEVTKYEEKQVLANEFTSLTSDSKLDEDEVEIKDIDGKLDVNGTNAAQLLGYTVDVYVNDDDEIVSINKSDDMNIELEVMSDDIEDGDSDFDETTFVYEDEDDEIEDVDIATNANVIKNGVWVAKINDGTLDGEEDEMVSSAGKVLLLDSNDDDKYDVIFVTETENYVVDEVLESKDKVYFKSDFSGEDSIELDSEDEDYDFVILKDGKEIGIKDLAEWDVLSIAADASDWDDATLFTINVSSKEAVKGKVTEEDDDEKYIDGKKYKVADNVSIADIDLGDEGEFYLDFYGKIAAFDTEEESENYAFVLDAGKKEGINATYQIELLTSNGDSKVYDIASKVKVNGNTQDDEDAVEALAFLDSANDFEGLVATLITYDLNSDGEVDQIDVPNPDDTANNVEYDDGDMDFQGNFYVDKDTIVFDVDYTDAGDYEVKGISLFADGDTYTLKAYDIDDAVAKVVVVTDSGSSNKVGSNVAVVNKITQTSNSDDDDVYKVYALVNGEEKTLLTTDDLFGLVNHNAKAVNEDVYFGELDRGYVIAYKTNADGDIDEFTVLFNGADVYDIDNITDPDNNPSTNDGDEDAELLEVVDVTDKTSRSVEIDNDKWYVIDKAEVYEYDAGDDEVSLADRGDIDKEDEVMIFKYDGDVVFILILK